MKESQNLKLILILIFLCLVAYYRAYDVPFLLDDFECIYFNPLIRDFTVYLDRQKAFEIFSANPKILKDTFNSFITRPLSYLTFSINYYINGLKVSGYHLTNIIIHTVNVVIIYSLVNETSKSSSPKNLPNPDSDIFKYNRMIAFTIAAIYAVHPIMTNAVTYIVQRMTSLVAMFYLGTILLYTKFYRSQNNYIKGIYYFISFISCCAAMLTKENAFTLPAILTIYDLVFCQGIFKQRVKRLALFFLSITIIPFNVIGLKNAEATQSGGIIEKSLLHINFTHITSWDYLMTQFRVVAFYIKLLVFPLGLSLEHDFRASHSFTDSNVLLSLVLHVSLFSYGIYLLHVSRSKDSHCLLNKLAGFGIIWFYVTLLVESSIIPMDAVAVEYRTYLPSFGFFLFVVSSIIKLLKKMFGTGKEIILGYALWIPVVVALMFVTLKRNEVMRNPEVLWGQTIAQYPNLIRPHASLAQHYINMNELQKAIEVYENALQKFPNVARLQLGLAKVYMLLNNYELAIPRLYSAIILNPKLKEPYYCLAIIFRDLGKFDQAESVLQTAKQLSHIE